MRRVLVTGMSGTGKSAVIAELSRRGYRAIDTDSDEWQEWVELTPAATPPGGMPGRDWVWREGRIRELLSRSNSELLFLGGCASNQAKFYSQLDHVVLLSAPEHILVERLAARTANPYGKTREELARILGHVRTVEPLLRRSATVEIDTTPPVGEVVDAILRACDRAGDLPAETHP